MTNPHLITSPPELVQQWSTKFIESLTFEELINEVARWGADQELEACCEQLKSLTHTVEQLRAARRPKPPSLKEQALAFLDIAQGSDDACNSWNFDTIRRALEALPND